jgi:hypothetical protein
MTQKTLDERPRHDQRPKATGRWRPRIPFRQAPRLHGTLSPTPFSPEEEALARSLAHELNYAAAVVARDPGRRFERACGAGAIQQLLEKKDDTVRRRARERAEALFGRAPHERHALFGDYAQPGGGDRLSRPVMNPERRALLRDVVRKRVAAYRSELQAYNDFAIAGGFEVYRVCTSELEGVISEDVNAYYKELTISDPGPLRFRWHTECDQAEVGVWEVRRLPSRSVVATGVAALNTSFTIDFSQFLAAPAPAEARSYDVRIRPHIAAKKTKVPGATPGSSSIVNTPAEAVAGFSNPVFIAYQRDDSPPQRFEEDVIYRKAELHIDHLEMVEQQSGDGPDEYWLYATLLESAGDQQVVAHELLKHRAVLNGAHDTSVIGFTRSFHLENPSSMRWPKTYTLLLSVLEEDGGEEVAEVMQFLWTWTAGALLGEVFDEIKKFLEEVGINEWSAGGLAAGLASAAAALAGSIVGAIAGAVLSLAAGIVQIVTQATQDDFYETKAVALALPTNAEDFVRQEMPGELAGGVFRLDPDIQEFHYWTLELGDFKAYDGLVEVRTHWELTNREDLSLG